MPEQEKVIPTICASHCGGSCLLKVHVKDGVITRISTDDGEEPQIRGCLRGRAQRQRVYSPGRLLYPMKRTGSRGEGRFERISWDEALDKLASELKRVRETYGPDSLILQASAGDVTILNMPAVWLVPRLLNLTGGYTGLWGVTSYQQALFSSMATYGTFYASNTRDDLPRSRMIIMWGWDPANTIAGPNTCWYLAQAREAGAKIVTVDTRFSDSVATFADQWIPIRPGTDSAMLIAMAHVMIREDLYDKTFMETHTIGFDRFKHYVLGKEDGNPKTPGWAEEITGVPSDIIVQLAREYAAIKPAALMAGIAPGRTAYGEQYHRAAITLAAMTGNVGVHGGDAASRAWESVMGGFPYRAGVMMAPLKELYVPNPVEKGRPSNKNVPFGYKEPRIHGAKLADAILKGKSGGYFADYRMLYAVNSNWLTQGVHINKLAKAFLSLEFIAVQEQFMTPTAKFADLLLPVNTFMERNDATVGAGTPFVGAQNKVIESLGESKSPIEIAVLLAEHMGIENFLDQSEEELLKGYIKKNGVPNYEEWKKQGIYRYEMKEPYVAFKKQIEDPADNPFPTPSGKIEIYSQAWADMNIPGLPPIPQYMEPWEGPNAPLAERYPLQFTTTHYKRRALSQFDNIPWLRELQDQVIWINTRDAEARGILDGDMVRAFNDRGETIIRAKVTERIMPGVVDIPHGAWYDPDENGVDRGGCANVLTSEDYSPGGGYVYNSSLLQVEKA